MNETIDLPLDTRLDKTATAVLGVSDRDLLRVLLHRAERGRRWGLVTELLGAVRELDQEQAIKHLAERA